MMIGSETMTTLEANIAMLATFSEEKQKEIYSYLLMHYGKDNPFKPMNKEEIYAELEESRECFVRGEYVEIETAVDAISERYGL